MKPSMSAAPPLWQITRAQAVAGIEPRRHAERLREHRALVEQALLSGAAVPAAVLADYPGLARLAERKTRLRAQRCAGA